MRNEALEQAIVDFEKEEQHWERSLTKDRETIAEIEERVSATTKALSIAKERTAQARTDLALWQEENP